MIRLPQPIRLPLAARELTRVARNPRMYWLRAAVVFSTFLFLVVEREWFVSSLRSPELAGERLRFIGTMFQFAVVFFVIPGIAGPLIAEERREGALGLLMVSGFTRFDIFLAKFIAAFAEAELLLLCTVPILSFSSILGGITVDLIVKQWFVLSICAFSTCCLGLLASSFVRYAVSAILLNLIVVATVIVLSVAIQEIAVWYFVRTIPQVDIVSAVWSTVVGNQPLAQWRGGLIAIAVIGVAAAVVTLLWLPHAAVTGPRRRWFGPSTPYGATHRRLLRQSPAAPFIACHSAGFLSTLQSSGSRRTLAVFITLIAAIPVAGGLAILFLLCYDITLSITSMRREGALDDLRVTRMGDKRLARDLYLYHLHRAVVYFPAFVVLAIQLAVAVAGMANLVVQWGNRPVRYAAMLDAMSPIGFYSFGLFLIVCLIALMAIQGPTFVAIACAAALGRPGGLPAWVRAIVMGTLLYGLIFGSYSIHRAFVAMPALMRMPWLPGVIVATGSVGLFLAAWWLAYRKIERGIAESLPAGVEADRVQPFFPRLRWQRN